MSLFCVLAATASAQFVPNAGQIIDGGGSLRPDIAFTAQSNGLILYFQNDRISYVQREVRSAPRSDMRGMPPGFDRRDADTVSLYRIDLEFVGSNPSASPQGSAQRVERANFYYPHTNEGIRNVPSYDGIIYRDLYPSIDLRYSNTSTGFKYDFIVRPGGRVSDIRLRYSGATSLSLHDGGSILLASPLGDLVDGAPLSFVDGDGDSTIIPSRFVVDGDDVRIDVDAYDATRTLVVDPTLIWATYCGGSGVESFGPAVPTIAIAPDGSTTNCGYTLSTNFPVNTGMLQTSLTGNVDAVLMRFRRDGSKAWSTYFGGSNYEYCGGIAIDAGGNIFHAGETASSNLPVTTNALQSSMSGFSDTYVIKLDSNGARSWSTYFGGNSSEMYGTIAVDSFGCFYLGASSFSQDMTTTGAFQTSRVGSGWNAMIARFDSSCALRWCTLAGEAITIGIATDRQGSVYHSGHVFSNLFPVTSGAYQTSLNGTNDAFVGSFDSTGAQRWATLIGGSAVDVSYGIAIDDSLNVALVGYTYSTDFPTTTDAFQRTHGGNIDAFASSFTSTGGMRWSTLYGSGSDDLFVDVKTDASRMFSISGWTTSSGISVTTPELPGQRGGQDCFLLRLDTAGARLWATRFGGSSYEWGPSLVLDGDAIVTSMISGSSNAPTTSGAFQRNAAGSNDFLIARICALDARIRVTGSRTLCPGDSVVLSAPVGASVVWSNGSTASSITVRNPGSYWLDATGVMCNARSDTVVVTRITASVTIAANGPLSFCDGGSVRLDAGPGALQYLWSTGATTRDIIVNRSGSYRVAIVAANGCRAYDTIDVVVFPLPRPAATASAIAFCPGDSVVLTLPAGYTRYYWSTGDTTSRTVVRFGGTIWYRVTDANGCQSLLDSIVIRQFTRPVTAITPSIATICPDDAVIVSADAGFARYEWSTGETTRSIRVTQAGAYRVVVVDSNGCHSDTTTSRISMHRRPTVEIVAGGPTTVCAGDSILLYASKRFSSYRWSTGDTTSSTYARASGEYTLNIMDSNGCRASARITATVRVAPKPTIGVIGSLTFCSGDEVMLTSGGFGTAYWSNGASGATIRVRESGSYWAMVIDEAGCRGYTDTVRVTVRDRPQVSLTGPLELCRESEAVYTLPDNPQYVYSWAMIGGDGQFVGATNASTSRIRFGTQGGTLRAIVEDRTTGCRDTINRAVTIGSTIRPAVAARPSTSLCAEDSVVLDAGPGYRAYRWSNGASAQQIVVTQPGRYAVWVETTSGCFGSSDSIDVVRGSASPVIAIDGPSTICEGGSVVLSTGSFASSAWSNGETTKSITVRSAGTYSVTVRDSNGCRGTSASVTITELSAPRIIVVGPTGACPGSTSSYCSSDTNLVDYIWSVDGGTITNGAGTACIVVRWGSGVAGGIRLNASDRPGGCVGTSDPLPVDLTAGLSPRLTATPTMEPCIGDTIEIDAGAGFDSYLWSTGESTRTIRITDDGVYNVDVSDASGCRGSASLEIHFTSRPATTIVIVGAAAQCDGDPTVLDAGDFARYRWSTGDTTRTTMVTSGGVYSVDVAGATGCWGSAEIALSVSPKPAPVIEPMGDRSICRGDSVELRASDGYAAYVWSNGATTQSIIVRDAGSYAVTVTDARGCRGTSAPVNVAVVDPPVVTITRQGAMLIARSTASSYQWLRDGIILSDETDDTIIARIPGRYSVIVGASEGCSAASESVIVEATTGRLHFSVDTVTARVGDRFLLTLSADMDDDALYIDSARIELAFASRSLFMHRVLDAGLFTSSLSLPGLLVLDHPGGMLPRGTIARFELEGLATAVPINPVSFAGLRVDGAGELSSSDGLVLLTGCIVSHGAAFGRAVTIESISPNPASRFLDVRYSAPADASLRLSIRDLTGREVYLATVLATGANDIARVDLATIATGYYVVELRDRGERSAVPVTIVK